MALGMKDGELLTELIESRNKIRKTLKILEQLRDVYKQDMVSIHNVIDALNDALEIKETEE